MSSVVSTSEGLLTAEQFAALPSSRRPQELIAGKVVDMPSPGTPHGQVIFNIAFLLKTYLKTNDIGRAWGAESGLITIRQPDSVRGMDAAFCSYNRWPKQESKKGLMSVAPELVIEVISPEDRWPRVLKKITEYFDSGVLVVCTVDPELRTLQIHMDASSSTVLRNDDLFEVPAILPGFTCRVSELFEGL
ncbi:MAG: Uma2 family endonuclease [Planctomycetales bacterium]|nr:Uma2 family endonuclease [Planctomycetales bacterium]